MNLDQAFQRDRLAMIRKVEDAVAKAWMDRDWGDDTSYLNPAVTIVEGGMMQVAALTDAYFSRKADSMDKTALAHHEYDVSKVRGVPATEVYSRPFGTLGAKLSSGSDFATADDEAADYVRKLVSTDMQLAFTHAARDWMEAHG